MAMLTVFEREYYDANYRDYDRQNPPWKLRHYRETVESYSPNRDSLRILDIGCAFGKFLASLDSRWQPYGIDPSQYAIGKAREALACARLKVVQDAKIPFQELFDAITAWDVLEHIPDLDAVARQVVEHLIDDGIFVFVVPVYDGPLGPVVRVLDTDASHIHRVSRNFWLAWTQQHFQIEAWWGVFRFLVPTGYYLHYPTQKFRRISPAIAVVARLKS